MRYEPRPGFIPGVAVNLSGNMLVLAPLGLAAVREFQARWKEIPDGDEDAQFSCGIDMVHASLRRNYPDITREEVESIVDIVSMKEAQEAINGVSGLKRVTPGELKAGS